MDENIYAPPKAALDSLPVGHAERPESRGGCLTVFLLFALVADAITSIISVKSLIEGTMLGQPLPPQWALVLLSISCSVSVVSCIAVWKWRRWGAYSFFGMATVILGVNLAVGAPVVPFATGSLAVVVVLAFLIRPIWRYMR